MLRVSLITTIIQAHLETSWLHEQSSYTKILLTVHMRLIAYCVKLQHPQKHMKQCTTIEALLC